MQSVHTITIQQLLDHEGGYNDGTNTSLPSASDPTYNMRAIALALGLSRPVQKLDVAKYMYGQPLQYTPGTNSAYSNYGYLLLSAIVEQVTGMPYFTYVQEKVLAPLGITEVLLSSTEAQQRDPNEAICEDQELGLDPINITSNLLIPAVYGGDGQIKEVAAGCAGLAASATALTQFIHVNLVWGNGPRPTGAGNWWIGRTGSTPGTSTEAVSLGGNIDWAYVINTRDCQTPAVLLTMLPIVVATFRLSPLPVRSRSAACHRRASYWPKLGGALPRAARAISSSRSPTPRLRSRS